MKTVLRLVCLLILFFAAVADLYADRESMSGIMAKRMVEKPSPEPLRGWYLRSPRRVLLAPRKSNGIFHSHHR